MTERMPGSALDVLFLAPRTPPAVGGRESVLRELLRGQPRRVSRLVAPRQAGAGAFDRAAGIDVRRFPQWPFLGDGPNRWVRGAHLRWVIRTRAPQLLVAYGLGAEATIAREAKRAGGTPYVLHVEAPELFAARRALRAGGERARALQEIFDETEAVIVASRACRLEAYKAGVLPHRIEVIPPGVDLERFHPGAKPEALARRAQTGKGPVLLTVAGRGPGKDPATLLRAFTAFAGTREGASLVVIGPVDGAWRTAADSLRLRKSVRFIGVVPDSELPDWYRLADLFVHAHAEDRAAGIVPGVEVAIAEALASGLPVVATAVPSVEGMVPLDEAGALVDPGAHAKLARAFADVLGDGEALAAMRAAARARAEQSHASADTSARLRELLEVVWFRRLGRGRLAPPDETPAAERPAA